MHWPLNQVVFINFFFTLHIFGCLFFIRCVVVMTLYMRPLLLTFHMNRANVPRPQCIHIIIFGSFLFLHRIFANLNRCVFYTYINWVQLFILDAFSAKLFFSRPWLSNGDSSSFFRNWTCSQFISKCLRCSILNPVPLFVFLHFYRLHESSANFLRPFSNSTLLKRRITNWLNESEYCVSVSFLRKCIHLMEINRKVKPKPKINIDTKSHKVCHENSPKSNSLVVKETMPLVWTCPIVRVKDVSLPIVSIWQTKSNIVRWIGRNGCRCLSQNFCRPPRKSLLNIIIGLIRIRREFQMNFVHYSLVFWLCEFFTTKRQWLLGCLLIPATKTG